MLKKGMHMSFSFIRNDFIFKIDYDDVVVEGSI